MRAISIPNYAPEDVYQTCINSIADPNLRFRLNQIINKVLIAANDYEQKASVNQLYMIAPNNSDNSTLVFDVVNKKELNSIYSSQMVGRTKPARVYYDELLARAPLGRCPFCGFGHASTLDHYLPKSKYPQFSVLPVNLIPSCKDCNTGKSTAIAMTAEEQCLHPYFENHNLFNDQWLFARVIHTKPATISYYVEAPSHWDNVSKSRMETHFNDFKLASRYSYEASNQLACLKDSLSEYKNLLGPDGVRKHLEIEAKSYKKLHCNSWQTALYQALASDDWYCSRGYE